MGRNIPVNKNAGIFVTMNPAGKAYGGRSKLPDNLKQLFRPVAMSVPDIELIAETMLFAEGFKHAKKLAAKVVSLFRLMKQLLSALRNDITAGRTTPAVQKIDTALSEWDELQTRGTNLTVRMIVDQIEKDSEPAPGRVPSEAAVYGGL